MAYNPNIHNRRSIRLRGYDYSKAGLYFITICCHDKECLFGEVKNGEMILNHAGKIADDCWLEIPKHFPNAVSHEFIVMPNHVHGIIELTQNNIGTVGIVGSENFLNLQYQQQTSQQQTSKPQRHEFQKMIPRSIASSVKGFKIGVTKWVRSNTTVHNVWQRNYYEHIIRNERSYQLISRYIINNPRKWDEDRFYK